MPLSCRKTRSKRSKRRIFLFVVGDNYKLVDNALQNRLQAKRQYGCTTTIFLQFPHMGFKKI